LLTSASIVRVAYAGVLASMLLASTTFAKVGLPPIFTEASFIKPEHLSLIGPRVEIVFSGLTFYSSELLSWCPNWAEKYFFIL